MNTYLQILTLIGLIIMGTINSDAKATESDREDISVTKSGSTAIALPKIIEDYIATSNSHEVRSIIACFADNAMVYDKHKEYNGIKAIGEWVSETVGKYKFQFRPLNLKAGGQKPIVTIEVSGTFPGSPITLDYYFQFNQDKISYLKIG